MMESITRKHEPGTGGTAGCVWFFAIAVLVGGVLLLSRALPPIVRAVRSHYWTQTTAVIEASETVDRSPRPRGRDWRLVYRYRAAVQDKMRPAGVEPETREFTAQHYDLNETGTTSRGSLAGQYRVGQQVPCWYDPRNPSDAVLERRIGQASMGICIQLLIGATLTALGVAVMRIAVLAALGWKRKRPQTPAIVQVPSTEPRRLQREAGSPRSVVVAFAIAAGVPMLAYLVSRIVPELGDLAQGTGFCCFLPVMLSIIGTVKYLRKFGGSGPTVEVSPGPALLGTRLGIAVSFAGEDQDRKLSVALVGREYREYTQDKKTIQEKAEFSRTAVPVRRGLQGRYTGEAVIPADSMHSFLSGMVRIEWLIETKFLRRGREVSIRYRLPVGPAPVKGHRHAGGSP